jgi:predicted nucleotide-binding protein
VPFLGELVAEAPALAQAALVLLTPDDVVRLHSDLWQADDPAYEGEPTGQPRPNVLIELGMVLMAYPERTLIVEMGRLRPISDLGGRNVIRFDGSATALGKIVERLKLAGCQVNDTGSDWRRTAPYRRLAAYSRTGRDIPPTR